MDYVLAFVTGGAICALVQLLMEKQSSCREG